MPLLLEQGMGSFKFKKLNLLIRKKNILNRNFLKNPINLLIYRWKKWVNNRTNEFVIQFQLGLVNLYVCVLIRNFIELVMF